MKDLTTELRLRQVLPTMFVLALVLVTVFGLVADTAVRRSAHLAAGILWLAFAFAGLLAVERAFASEKEDRTLPGLLAAPIQRQTVFAAKCLTSFALLLAVQVFAVPIAALLFEYSLSGPALPLLAVLVLGDAAVVILGTLASAMVVPARTRGSLLAALVLPLLIPAVLVGTACTAELASFGSTARAGHLLLVLLAFDAVFAAAAYLVFPYVIKP